MKIVSFSANGTDSYGVVSGDSVIDVGAALKNKYRNLRVLIKNGGLDELRDAAAKGKPAYKLSAITYLPLLTDPKKIFAIGINYDEHRKETGRDPSAQPTIFVRFADAQVGHLQPMIKPLESDNFDFEGELAVIIGKKGRRIAEKDALSHIAGYSIYNDGSVRDFQRHTTQFTPGKNFLGTGPFGPWLVTADEIPDPQKLQLETRLNGQVMQKSGTDMMIFQIPYLIHYISIFTKLRPGDVIITGTPGGVGNARTPPVYMKGGDTIEVEISKIGILRNPVVNEK